MNEDMKPCPRCDSPYGYALGQSRYASPKCDLQWNPEESNTNASPTLVDANGNELVNGDTVIVTKDLPVKGAPKPIKAGTKVKNIHLTEGDHNISCKIDGFGALALKSIYVKKG
ncbi:MAG: zinc ribbon domain-containing protein YjdM [Flavobacteriaceae bacterium]